MPKLPPIPNLEHLKGQAKRLLSAQRACDLEAEARFAAYSVSSRTEASRTNPYRLADAQFVLAREYGFPSWTRMKAYIEALTEDAALNIHTSARDSSSHQHFVHELAEALLRWARERDTEALGARFATLPLRDILAARGHLVEMGRTHTVIDGLIEGLEHPKPRVRFNCAGALDHFADARCTEPLRRRLGDPTPRVRRAALHSLSCDACKLSPLTPVEDFIPIFIEMARYDSSVRVRRAATFTLETYCRDARVEATLRDLAASDPDRRISEAAQVALKRRETVR